VGTIVAVTFLTACCVIGLAPVSDLGEVPGLGTYIRANCPNHQAQKRIYPFIFIKENTQILTFEGQLIASIWPPLFLAFKRLYLLFSNSCFGDCVSACVGTYC